MLIPFITGLLGSLHCVGMCGPIAMMLPVSGRNQLMSRLLYTLGKSFSYASVGALIGLMGWGVGLMGYQQWLSMAMGGILLVLGFMNFFSADTSAFYVPGLSKQIAYVKKQLGKFLRYNSYSGNFMLGFLNGFLPCGLVYIALAGALAEADLWKSTLYMFMFGLGTSPLIMVVLMSNQLLNNQLRTSLTKMIPVFTIIVACMLILRGLNLGIPYLSPYAEEVHNGQPGSIECHTK